MTPWATLRFLNNSAICGAPCSASAARSIAVTAYGKSMGNSSMDVPVTTTSSRFSTVGVMRTDKVVVSPGVTITSRTSVA